MFLIINFLDRLGFRYDRLRLRDRLRLGDDWNGDWLGDSDWFWVRGWWAVTSSHLY